MATEIFKILTENSAATKLRSLRKFNTVAYDEPEQNILPLNKLIFCQSNSDPLSIEFVPIFMWGELARTIDLNFRDWWTRDIIYRGIIPLT
jgi:hypothetical protein